MIKSVRKRIASLQRDMLLFISAIAAAGFAESIVNSVFNNFLNETFNLDSIQRTFMELPREMPGVLIIFVSAMLYFVRSRRLAAIATLSGAAGLVLMAFFSISFHWMLAWLFVLSMGQHLFMPLNTSITMGLAREGQTGKRLGQFNAIRNCAIVIGSFAVVLGFKYLHFNFRTSFLLASACYLVATFLVLAMKPGTANKPATHLKFHREYILYYWLSILFGSRKQIFLTFAPWVLVTVFHQPTAILATLLTVSGAAGILFQPILGRAIDRLGEKIILTCEALMLIVVCAGYGFGKTFFDERTAFLIASICFVMDQLLFSVNIARSTYFRKIAVKPEHVTPTLTMSVSLDHIFSVGIALTGGVMWAKWGYQTVFIAGAFIALINLISVQFIKIPAVKTKSIAA
jgi:predicted MFS family arabinose efflux permease